MKRKIIIYSPFLYSFISFIINLILGILIILAWIFILDKSLIWLSPLIGIFYVVLFWLLFLFSKILNLYSFWRLFYTNTATTTSELFIHFHIDQKVKELEKGFKLIKVFGNFTSWFWVFALIYKKNLGAKKVLAAFKKFVVVNPKIYRLLDLEDFLHEIPPIEIDYIVVEI